jgi:hypothetical protein
MGPDSSLPSRFGRWGNLDITLFQYVVARILQTEPSTAVSLLQVNSTFYKAASEVLYEELYIQDDDEVIDSPPPNTRHEAIVHYPKYASLVRTLVLIPSQVCREAVNIHSDASYFSAQGTNVTEPIQPETFGLILQTLPNLEAVVW